MAKRDLQLTPDELKAVADKMKPKEADELTFTTPVIGVISLSEWQYEAVTIVASASAHPLIAAKWMHQIEKAEDWSELHDPECFISLGQKVDMMRKAKEKSLCRVEQPSYPHIWVARLLLA